MRNWSLGREWENDAMREWIVGRRQPSNFNVSGHEPTSSVNELKTINKSKKVQKISNSLTHYKLVKILLVYWKKYEQLLNQLKSSLVISKCRMIDVN